MTAPQIIVLLVMAVGLGVHYVKDGQAQPVKYSFRGRLLSNAIIIALLYWGGFFGVVTA